MGKLNLNKLVEMEAFDVFDSFRFKDYKLSPWNKLGKDNLKSREVILFEGLEEFQSLRKSRYEECKSVYLLTNEQVSNFDRQTLLGLEKFKVKDIIYSKSGDKHFHEFPMYKTIGMNKDKLETYLSLGLQVINVVGVEDIERIFKNFKY
jgi:hypothetical protein